MVRDDGVGFDATTARTTSSLGFVSMNERVRLIDGTLTVESEKRKGTTVVVAVAL